MTWQAVNLFPFQIVINKMNIKVQLSSWWSDDSVLKCYKQFSNMLFQVKQFDHLSLIEKKSFEIPLKQ